MPVARPLLPVAVLTLVNSSVWAQYPSQVKFLSYNLWGYHNAETPGGYDSLASVINDIDPDISGHQEVDRVNTRSKRVDVIAYLGDLTMMHSLFAPALKGWRGGDYGEGLLSDHPPLSHRFFWERNRKARIGPPSRSRSLWVARECDS